MMVAISPELWAALKGWYQLQEDIVEQDPTHRHEPVVERLVNAMRKEQNPDLTAPIECFGECTLNDLGPDHCPVHGRA